MDIQQIRYFLAVAKYESFSKAAQKLFVTQPILTRCVKALEEELGATLIVRSTRSFALTDAGQTLVEYGSQLVRQHEDIYRRIRDVQNVQTGELQISCPGVLLDMYFPPLVTQFHRQYPGVRINIAESGSRPIAQEIREGTADIGLVMLPLEDAQGLSVFPIIRDEVRVIVRQDHPFARESRLELDALAHRDLITYNASATLYHTFLQMCRDRGFTPHIAYKSMMPNFILDTIACGACVGVLPGPMLRLSQGQNLVSVPLQPSFPWEIAMIAAKDRYLSHAAASFLRFSQDYFLALSGQ